MMNKMQIIHTAVDAVNTSGFCRLGACVKLSIER